MRRFRALASARRSIPSLRRALSTTRPSSDYDDELQDEVLVKGKAAARTAILNRPFALNALTNSMIDVSIQRTGHR